MARKSRRACDASLDCLEAESMPCLSSLRTTGAVDIACTESPEITSSLFSLPGDSPLPLLGCSLGGSAVDGGDRLQEYHSNW
jgi:hypothetical protein